MSALYRLIAPALLGLVLCVAYARAQGPSPVVSTAAPATAIAVAPPDATAMGDVTVAELQERVADLEAYMNNTAQKRLLVAGPGHNGWMMTCSALVLFMTLPGLALFYGGLVRRKNALSVLAQCIGIAGMVILLWWAFGYSLVFGTSFNSPYLGGSEHFFLMGVGPAPNTGYASWISQSVFCMYQLMFAIITPALIVGAIAERMKFSAIMLFVLGWMLLVYFPVAHMMWGAGGLMNGVWNADAGIKAIDFAGGIVVHMTSGWSALVLCLILGKRIGYGKLPMPPHSMVLCMVGTGMLWVGWYGFNAGSALAADGIAGNAFMTTTLSAGVASVTWALIEHLHRGKPSILGFCSGAVGGLATITPACGFVTANAAVLIGILAGAVPFYFCTSIKGRFGYDDALDTFGVHAVGGTLGALLTGVFATAQANPNLANNLGGIVGKTLWLEQLKAMGLTFVLSIVATVVLASVVRALCGGLRPTPEVEEQGLDIVEHGEEAYTG